MVFAIFALVCAVWGVLLGSILVAVLTTIKRLLELTSHLRTGVITGVGYWLAAAGAFVTLHLHYIVGDDVGRHAVATLGFYIGAAIPFILGPVRRRAILRSIR